MVPLDCRAAEIDPCVGGRPVDVHLVLPVGPVDQLPLLVEERDEEVVGVHQLADDGVHRPVELLHVLGRARELGDPVERSLNRRGIPAVSLGCLELRQPPPRLGELGRKVAVGSHRGPVTAPKLCDAGHRTAPSPRGTGCPSRREVSCATRRSSRRRPKHHGSCPQATAPGEPFTSEESARPLRPRIPLSSCFHGHQSDRLRAVLLVEFPDGVDADANPDA